MKRGLLSTILIMWPGSPESLLLFTLTLAARYPVNAIRRYALLWPDMKLRRRSVFTLPLRSEECLRKAYTTWFPDGVGVQVNNACGSDC